MDNKTRFFYVRNPETWHPVGCIAYRTKSDGQVEFETSTWNPHDKWNKQMAREIAEGRLEKHPQKISLDTRTSVHTRLLESICSINSHFPKRLVKNAEKMLEIIDFSDDARMF